MRKYLIHQLMRWERSQWKALQQQCKRTQETPTAYLRRLVDQDTKEDA